MARMQQIMQDTCLREIQFGLIEGLSVTFLDGYWFLTAQ